MFDINGGWRPDVRVDHAALAAAADVCREAARRCDDAAHARVTARARAQTGWEGHTRAALEQADTVLVASIVEGRQALGRLADALDGLRADADQLQRRLDLERRREAR